MRTSAWLSAQWGLLRSLMIYHGQPWKWAAARRFYSQFIEAGDLCFDIGAHVGGRTRTWRALGARCVAVEPHPQCMGVLRHLYSDCDDVVLVEAAAGTDTSSTRKQLYFSPTNLTVSTLSTDWIARVRQSDSFSSIDWEQTLDVEVTTLDALIEAYGQPDFCKIDVEGGELDVLRGLHMPVKQLSFEYIPASIQVALACIERLTELGGYEFNWSVGENLSLNSSRWLRPDDIARQLQGYAPDEDSGDVYARTR